MLPLVSFVEIKNIPFGGARNPDGAGCIFLLKNNIAISEASSEEIEEFISWSKARGWEFGLGPERDSVWCDKEFAHRLDSTLMEQIKSNVEKELGEYLVREGHCRLCGAEKGAL